MNDAYYDKFWDELATDHSLMSYCCGVPPFGEVYRAKNEDPVGICAKCKDHSTFERVDSEGEPIGKPKEREFTAEQWDIIEQLKQGCSEEA